MCGAGAPALARFFAAIGDAWAFMRVPFAILRLSPEGEVLRANRAAHDLARRVDPDAHSVRSLLPFGWRELLPAARECGGALRIWRHVAGGRTLVCEARFLRRHRAFHVLVCDVSHERVATAAPSPVPVAAPNPSEEREQRLRGALATQGFALHYQPQIDLRSTVVIGAEAVLRWHDPAAGAACVPDCMSVAESVGVDQSLGEWILRKACAQNARWRRDGRGPMRVTVKTTLRQLRHDHFVATVRSALEETGLEPCRLELEVPESAAGEETSGALRELRKAGVGLALGDFGKGRSDLRRLRALPVDRLKLDRSFLESALPNSGLLLARTAIELGHNLGLQVRADGVSSKAIHDALASYRCDEAQGSHVGDAVNAEAFAGLIRP